MKLRIEISDGLAESEVTIRCGALTEDVLSLEKYILSLKTRAGKMACFKGDTEYYIPLSDVLFFETDGNMVFVHTGDDSFAVKERLYELLHILPPDFIRVSKSTILNIRHIYSIDRNLAASSMITFYKSHKKVYVSRLYYKALKERIQERRGHER